MSSFKESIAAGIIRKMPPGLRHSVPGQSFNIKDSEVVAWFVSQPEILQYLFQKAKDAGSIIYDPQSQTWSGKDFKNDS